MEFTELLHAVEDEPLFETGLLLSGGVDSFNIRKQLSRWTASGKLIQLRRGLYCLAPPYQKTVPHPFLIANRLVRGSYVSLQSALAYYGLIPEAVPVTTSTAAAHSTAFSTPYGRFDFRHIQMSWFCGYHQVELGNHQSAFVAAPEKALLDLVYLQPGGDDEKYLRSLRLQGLERLDLNLLLRLASTADSLKLARAANFIARLTEEEKSEYLPL